MGVMHYYATQAQHSGKSLIRSLQITAPLINDVRFITCARCPQANRRVRLGREAANDGAIKRTSVALRCYLWFNKT